MTRYAGRLPRTYSEAEAALNGRDMRTLLHNTTIGRDRDGLISVAYHGNVIAVFSPDGARAFTNAGWGTVSTRERLNAMTPPGVGFAQRKGEQVVMVGGEPMIGGAVTITATGGTYVS